MGSAGDNPGAVSEQTGVTTATSSGEPICPRDDPSAPLRIAVLVSGGGTTLQHLIDRSVSHGDGSLHAEVVAVVASKSEAGGLERALRHGVPARAVPRQEFNDAADHSTAVFNTMADLTSSACPPAAELVVMAGYLSLLVLPPRLMEAYRHRIINIHPALLPAFGGRGMYGKRVHEAVLAHGCKVSGCTVHLADESYDTGPILTQRACEVKDEDNADSLAGRVQAQERPALVDAINRIASGRLELQGRRVMKR